VLSAPGRPWESSTLGITIAICTWNRSQSLRATLLSLQQLVAPSGIDWELIIVDNNCSDDTDEVIAHFADGLPIRLLREIRQGHSYARNCAVAAARGDYILWTDDDVIVDPYWLVAYANALRTWPKAALFGGPIKLELKGNPPSWFAELLIEEDFTTVYAHRDLSNVPIKLNLKRGLVPYGANLCIRMREQRNLLYNPRLGRCRSEQIRGEEVEVVRTLLDSGSEGWWVPNAIVRHVIAEDLQTQAHLRKYFVGLGRRYVREDPKRKLASFFRAMRLLMPATWLELRFQVNRLKEPPKIWFKDLSAASICWGRLIELLRT
jgi:glycosyltransferase involved in cell wall biosynthesis